MKVSKSSTVLEITLFHFKSILPKPVVVPRIGCKG